MRQNVREEKEEEIIKEDVEKGRRLRVIMILFLLAIVSLVVFFVLRIALGRFP